nr:unnamed protein product [Digitaria exilis]
MNATPSGTASGAGRHGDRPTATPAVHALSDDNPARVTRPAHMAPTSPDAAHPRGPRHRHVGSQACPATPVATPLPPALPTIMSSPSASRDSVPLLIHPPPVA